MSLTTIELQPVSAGLQNPVPVVPQNKPQLPNPQLSVGIKCHPLGRNQCWELTGPARDMCKLILQATKALLESRCDFVNQGQRQQFMVIFGMYMIGKNKEKACPTLLFSCEFKGPRRRAIELAKGEELLKDYPFVKLAESKRPPLALQIPIHVASHGDESRREYIDSWMESSTDPHVPIYYLPAMQSCGTLIAEMNEGKLSNIATLGGIVIVNDQSYGLTAEHVFRKDVKITLPQGVCDSEFAFDGEDEDSDAEDYEEELFRATSKGSISSASGRSSTLSPVNRDDDKSFENFGQLKSWENVSFASEAASTAATLPHIPRREAWHVLGNLHSSISTHQKSADWALVQIENPRFLLRNTIQDFEDSSNKPLCPTRIVQGNPYDKDVIVATGMHGNLRAKISGTPAYMLWPFNSQYQEVWIVRFSQTLAKGNSGSWVIDAQNGDLCGHIVAGHPDSNVAYMVSSTTVFKEIETSIGGCTLASTEDFEHSNHIIEKRRSSIEAEHAPNENLGSQHDSKSHTTSLSRQFQTATMALEKNTPTGLLKQFALRLRVQQVKYFDFMGKLYGSTMTPQDGLDVESWEAAIWTNKDERLRLESFLDGAYVSIMSDIVSKIWQNLDQIIIQVRQGTGAGGSLAFDNLREKLFEIENLQGRLEKTIGPRVHSFNAIRSRRTSNVPLLEMERWRALGKILATLEEVVVAFGETFNSCQCRRSHIIRLGLSSFPADRTAIFETDHVKLLFVDGSRHYQQTYYSRGLPNADHSPESKLSTFSEPSSGSLSIWSEIGSKSKASYSTALSKMSEEPLPPNPCFEHMQKRIVADAISISEKFNGSFNQKDMVMSTPYKNFGIIFDGMSSNQGRSVRLDLQDYLLSPSSTRKGRFQVAVSLCHHVLVLHNTSWLDERWTMQDFDIQDEQLFIKRTVRSKYQETPPPAYLDTTFWECVGEPILTRLGFALVELAFGQNLSNMRHQSTPVTGTDWDSDMIDLFTARTLLESGAVLERQGQAYHNAVSAFLTHQVVVESRVMTISSHHLSFLQVLEDIILRPLIDSYNASWGNLPGL